MSQYATLSDLGNYLPGSAQGATIDAQKTQALIDASALADGKLASRYTLPLIAPYPRDLVYHVCNIAVYSLMCWVGYSTEAGGNKQYRDRYDDAMTWLDQVAAGTLTPAGAVDATVDTDEGGPDCWSLEPRGW